MKRGMEVEDVDFDVYLFSIAERRIERVNNNIQPFILIR